MDERAFQVWSGSVDAYTFTVHHCDSLDAALDLAFDEWHRPHTPDVLVRRDDGSTVLTLLG